MEVCRRSSWLLLLLGVLLLANTLQGVQGEVESEGPSESECRPYIEKALKELETGDGTDPELSDATQADSIEEVQTIEIITDDSAHLSGEGNDDTRDEDSQSVEQTANDEPEKIQEAESAEDSATETNPSAEETDDDVKDQQASEEVEDEPSQDETEIISQPEPTPEEPETVEATSIEEAAEDKDTQQSVEEPEAEQTKEASVEESQADEAKEESSEAEPETKESVEAEQTESVEVTQQMESVEISETAESVETEADKQESAENEPDQADSVESEPEQGESVEATEAEASQEQSTVTEAQAQEDETTVTQEVEEEKEEEKTSNEQEERATEEQESVSVEAETAEELKEAQTEEVSEKESEEGGEESKNAEEEVEPESAPEEELSFDIEIPTDLREREHVEKLLKLDDSASVTEQITKRIADITLRELKKLYENAIKPLETLYKYRDLSNRHFGDSEIFSKPLILFMGPWSGGKSSIINYLLGNEYNETSLRTGAEPSPAYFNLVMHGEEPEIVDGTQLAADFTFAGLQKFGQGLEERLRGVKLPNKLLEKVNIVEIPGILEVRKQVSRVFPFNDACQWFIDRADIIFLVYDPSKLDVGPETEAILDQLKGREHQTRIILNKADQVKPEELMRVQGALIWNISPLMSSPQPPVMYTTSLWSRPYEAWAPTRLLQAQERAFLRDLRTAIDKRIEHKIASARRFAVRVRNHAKMVDCYLTTYYNHKSVFGNRKQVADTIIEHPQDYHIYEGLSTLTNISRYDLPDPEVYKDFFKLNALYDFQQLSATCTYFRGCPINRLDVAIAYDLPELVGKHKRLVENALAEANPAPVPGS